MTDRTPDPAAAAAAVAGVHIRTVDDLTGLAALDRLLAGIWSPDPQAGMLTTDLLRALTLAGNYVAGAYDSAGTPVGAAVGFFGPPDARELHSHVTGVSAAAAGRSVGFALKLHQRAWALSRGAEVMSWTFDPLVARNAYFNLAKLGAVAIRYLPDFYGPMHDRINGADDSDRLLVHWHLSAPAVVAAVSGTPSRRARPPGATAALSRSAAGGPVPGSQPGPVRLVAVPADIEALRRSDPAAARLWRRAVRDSLGPLLTGGLRITGFDRDGGYVLTRATEEPGRSS